MDIYKARDLQKALFKYSDCSFKRMGIIFSTDKTKIAYFIIHHMCANDSMAIEAHDIKRMVETANSGVITRIDYISDERKKKDILISPVGLYMVEIIPID